MNTERNLQKAEYFWTQLNHLLDKDALLPSANIEAPQKPQEGWLKTCRESLLIGQNEMALRLGLSRQAYAKLECNEVSSVISLESLQKAAEAMDCECIYWIRPKKRKSFSSVLWGRLLPSALRAYRARMRSNEINKPIVLARIAQDLFQNPAFRRKMRWTRNIGF